jgi:hypothetical protein
MNTILPFGISRLNTASSKFDIDSGSVLIGLDTGTQLSDIDNVFIGNSAGSKSTVVSESVFLGMYAGQEIQTGKKSIIIGNDKSTQYLNKNNIVSIGYNDISAETVGIGSNIISTGNYNVLAGRDINSSGDTVFSYGKTINTKNSLYFFNSFIRHNNDIYIDGFNKIGLLDIKSNTNYYSSNLFHISYEFNQSIMFPNTIFRNETDIIFKFMPKAGNIFNFNLSFYDDNHKILIDFVFKNNAIEYINNETAYANKYSFILPSATYTYDKYNTIHIINNDKNYMSLSIYINPIYNGTFIVKNKSQNISQGKIGNIINPAIKGLKLTYSLGNQYNVINSNYLFSYQYTQKYQEKTSNVTIDYDAFNNAAVPMTFKDFIISVNHVSTDAYNAAYGKDLNIRGLNNICIGKSQNVEGDNSVIIGNYISTGSLFKSSTNSIIVGNNNFLNNFNKDVIVIGNSNFTMPYSEAEYYEFLDKEPFIIGSGIDDITYNLNIYNTICKYEDGKNSNELLMTGMKGKYDNFLPVAIGFSCNTDVPIKHIYKAYEVSNVYTVTETVEEPYTYYIDEILYTDTRTYEVQKAQLDVFVDNPKVLSDDKYALYVKHGIYSDTLSLYNASNYNTKLYKAETSKQNTHYVLPETPDQANDSINDIMFLSYSKIGDSTNILYWNTIRQAFLNADIHVNSITSLNFIGVGSNLRGVNLDDRNTSMLAEGTNLYFTPERAGTISHASNVKAMNYTLETSNLISHRITRLSTDEITEGSTNLYYTGERFDERLMTKTLDYIHNGTSNKYITNDIYTNSLLITGTLTVGKIQVLGVDFQNSGQQIEFATKNEVNELKQRVDNLSILVNSLVARVSALEA